MEVRYQKYSELLYSLVYAILKLQWQEPKLISLGT